PICLRIAPLPVPTPPAAVTTSLPCVLKVRSRSKPRKFAMSALDRALIRAYRQQRGGAASYEPPRHAPPIPPHSQHAAQVDLAGPHYRLDAPHHSTHETAVASATPDEWPTFRVDVGVAGVPVAPNLVLTERAGAEPEAKRELAPAGAPTSAV